MKVYILYQTDAWLSHASKQIIAICSTTPKAVEMARENAEEQREPLKDDDINMLDSYSQTQGRDTNYLIEEAEINRIIG